MLGAGHIHSGYSQPWAIGAGSANDRPWVVSGDAFGLMAWTTADQAYELFYKDDDARVSRHDIAAIWVAIFLRCQRYRC